MTKTLEENFRDWEASVFGFGYGTGEEYILPALKTLFASIGSERSDGPVRGYDYRILEQKLGALPAWLLINRFCQIGLFEYGTSPRFGWISKEGGDLKKFIDSKTADELYEIVTGYDSDYIHCYPNACNCGPDGYDSKAVCQNPFWVSGKSLR